MLSTRNHKGTVLKSKSERRESPVQEESPTLYDILGVAWGASQKDIRKAYGGLAKKYHPDVCGDDEASKQYFFLVKDAYEVLSDDVLRARYNNVLMSQGYTPPKGSVSRGQELGMSEWQFFLVVLLVNPFYLFLLGPLFGVKIEDVKSFLNLN
jgi:curved DNA-binding protein CbpA